MLIHSTSYYINTCQLKYKANVNSGSIVCRNIRQKYEACSATSNSKQHKHHLQLANKSTRPELLHELPVFFFQIFIHFWFSFHCHSTLCLKKRHILPYYDNTIVKMQHPIVTIISSNLNRFSQVHSLLKLLFNFQQNSI